MFTSSLFSLSHDNVSTVKLISKKLHKNNAFPINYVFIDTMCTMLVAHQQMQRSASGFKNPIKYHSTLTQNYGT